MSHGPDTGAKFHEALNRYPGRTEDGKDVEILERVTFERRILGDGSLDTAREINRRYDLRTGERLDRLGADEFAMVVGGARIKALPQA